MKGVRQRYMTDQQFKAMVDMMVAYLHNCDYTPSEMREAAILASIIYYEQSPQSIMILRQHLILHEFLEGKEGEDEQGK